MRNHITSGRRSQRGAALAIGLILLAVASLATVASISAGTMHERMSANQDNHARAFMAAEAGGADLVAWIRANGWPTASNHPALQNQVIAGNPSIAFTLTLRSASWSASPLDVLIEGRALSVDGASVLARTPLLVSLQRPPPPAPPPPVNAPAAISCFDGRCRIIPGTGRGADEGFGIISGFDHPIPPLNCSGGGCRMQPQGANRTMPAMPAVFLTHEPDDADDQDDRRGGRPREGGFNAFQGLDSDGDGIVRGNDLDDVAREPDDYPDDPVTGVSTAPTWTSVMGGDVPRTRLESGRTGLAEIGGSGVEVGTLVLDGQHLDLRGNALFVGLIVIRNCGTMRMNGNPNIYGAVIVEATRSDGTACPPDYSPFVGSGTPAVRYSSAALVRAANPPGVGVSGPAPNGVKVLRWTEFFE